MELKFKLLSVPEYLRSRVGVLHIGFLSKINRIRHSSEICGIFTVTAATVSTRHKNVFKYAATHGQTQKRSEMSAKLYCIWQMCTINTVY